MSEETKEVDAHMSTLMNPRVRVVKVGTRTLRKIKVYPFSLADQLEMNDILVEGIQTYFNEIGEELTPKAISALMGLIKANINKIISLVCPDEDAATLTKEIDNAQLAEIVEIVYQVNYGEPAKKLVSLFRGEKTAESPMERLSRLSVGATPATESSISPDSDIKKEGLPTAN